MIKKRILKVWSGKHVFLNSIKIQDKKHILVIHREKKTKDDFDTNINIMKIKTYGRSKIIFAIFN